MGTVGRPEESSHIGEFFPLEHAVVTRVIPALGGIDPEKVNAVVTEQRDLLDVTNEHFAGFLTGILGELNDRGIAIDPRAFDHGALFVSRLLEAQAAFSLTELPPFSTQPQAEVLRELHEFDRLAREAGTSPDDIPTSARSYLTWVGTKGGDLPTVSAIFDRSLTLYRNPDSRQPTIGQDSFVIGAAITYSAYRRQIESKQVENLFHMPSVKGPRRRR